MNCLITKSLSCYRGKGDYYRLGTDSTAHVREPQLVESLTKKVVQVAVGSLHILALTENGEVRVSGPQKCTTFTKFDRMVNGHH